MSEEIALSALKDDSYRLGQFQAIRYDRKNHLFPDDFLATLYFMCRDSRRRTGDGIISAIFGGSLDPHFDSVVSYFARAPLIVIGEWTEDGFKPAGIGFVVVVCGNEKTPKSAFCGYGIFKDYWGTEDAKILTILGLTALFQEFNLVAIHGTRYQENVLTARFMSQFGFKTIGEIPHYQIQGDKLVPGIVSTLERSEFSAFLDQWLADAWRQANL